MWMLGWGVKAPVHTWTALLTVIVGMVAMFIYQAQYEECRPSPTPYVPDPEKLAVEYDTPALYLQTGTNSMGPK